MRGPFSGTFSLPSNRNPIDVLNERRARYKESSPNHSIRRQRILIIEDDIELINAYSALKDETRWPLYIASNSSTALAELTRRAYDTLILDWNLPDFNGGAFVDLSDQMLDNHSDTFNYIIENKTPVITFSSESELLTNVDKSKYFFRKDHWRKPIKFPEIRERIEQLIYSPAQLQKVER